MGHRFVTHVSYDIQTPGVVWGDAGDVYFLWNCLTILASDVLWGDLGDAGDTADAYSLWNFLYQILAPAVVWGGFGGCVFAFDFSNDFWLQLLYRGGCGGC